MRLGLFDRIRRLVHPRRAAVAGGIPQGRHRRNQRHPPPAGPAPGSEGSAGTGGSPAVFAAAAAGTRDEWPSPAPSLGPGAPPGSDRRPPGSPAVRVGGARARIREAPSEAIPAAATAPPGWYDAEPPAGLARTADMPVAADARAAADMRVAADARAAADMRAAADARAAADVRAASGVPRQAGEDAGPPPRARAALRMRLPFAPPHPAGRARSADGRRHCGSLEAILWRQWDAATLPPQEVTEAIDRLAELPEQIKARLAAELDAIFVGPGGVPELDEMTALRGVRLPSGQASWDACAGAYGERKVVVGSQPSPTPDVMCHEIGHALDDLDSPPGKWQSDSAEFRMLYDQCQPNLTSDFHRQPGGLGRKEFFADAFAAIASAQRPALVDMLTGDTRTALRVMLYFNRRYGI